MGRTRFIIPLLPVSLAAMGLACESNRAVVLGVSTSPPYVDAARLAIEDELAAGPLPRFSTVMMPQGQNLASPAIEAAQRLVEAADLIAVVGHSNSAASLATAPIYNAHQVVQIAPTASATVYSQAGPYSFRLVPPDHEQGLFLAQRLSEILPGGGRVALVYVNDDYGRGLRASLLAELDAQRYRVVYELPQLESPTDDEDAAYAADALGDAQPDLIVWLARGELLARFLVGIRKRLPAVPIVGGDGLGTGGLERVPRVVMGDVRFVAFLDLDATEALRTFRRRYRERFGRDASASAALTYDAVRLAIAGIRTGARSGPDLRAYLSALGRSSPAYLGIAGPIAFDDDGDVQRPYVLIRGGSEDNR
jgi:branched-chain amino acid transport system substrate-binding protein